MDILTFVTNARYKPFASQLIKSGKKFGYYIRIVNSTTKNPHSWSEAIVKKVEIIKAFYCNKPLLYLDADCEIIRPLDELFSNIRANNLSIRYRENHANPFQAGVMGFGTGMSKFIHNWLRSVQKQFGNNKTVDQECLSQLLNGEFSKIQLFNIGPYYNFTEHDGIELDRSEAYILHHKASKHNDHARGWFKKFMRKKE